jgi:ABC-2 type transport system permease protein
MNKALVEMVKGRLREFRREPSAFFFVLFMPVVWMLILGGAFSGSTHPRAAIGWVSGAGDFSTRVQKILEANPDFTVQTGTVLQQRKNLGKGAVEIFAEPTAEGHILYHYDDHHPDAQHVSRWVDETIQVAFGRTNPVITEARPESVPGSRYIDFLLPGLLAFSLLTTSLFGTGMTLVSHRRENLLRRFLTTPIRPQDYILSHLIGRMFIMGLELTVILSAGFLLFGFRIQGSWSAFLGLCVLGTASFTAIAIAAGARMTQTSTYNSLVNLLTLPMMLLSGIWFSRSHFPAWSQDFLQLLPLTALVDGLRHIALEGEGWREVQSQLWLLTLYGVIAFGWARNRFRW